MNGLGITRPGASATMLIFFKPGCRHCEGLLGDVAGLSSEFAANDISILAVSIGDGTETARFVREQGFPFVIQLDRQRANRQLGIRTVPTVFVVNESGSIVKKWMGRRSKAFLRNIVAEYEPTSSTVIQDHRWGQFFILTTYLTSSRSSQIVRTFTDQLRMLFSHARMLAEGLFEKRGARAT